MYSPASLLALSCLIEIVDVSTPPPHVSVTTYLLPLTTFAMPFESLGWKYQSIWGCVELVVVTAQRVETSIRAYGLHRKP